MSNKKKKIVIPLPDNICNINFASGTLASIYNSLDKHFDLIPVGPFKLKKSFWKSAFNQLSKRGYIKRKYATIHTWKTIKSYSEQLNKKLEGLEYDAVFSTSTLHAVDLKTDKPVYAFTDFSFFNALNYYSFATNLIPSSKEEALTVDKYCFNQYTKVFLASEWACRQTTKAYDLSKDKVVPVGRGANLVSDLNEDQVSEIIEKRLTDRDVISFLFVGVNWLRKGGPVAFQIVQKLQESGLNIHLDIVGCNPPKEVIDSKFTTVHSFLDRSNSVELKKLKNMFEKSMFFIMPTKAEAMGIVFAEAASFGLPSIAYDTGGVSTAIENDITGLLFNSDNTIDDIILKIQTIIIDHNLYKSMAIKAYEKYINELNWDVIISKIKGEMKI